MQIGLVTRLDMSFSYGALIMAMALISIIGGRITPAFSASWLRQRGGNAESVRVIPALDIAALFSMIVLMASLVTGWQTVTALVAVTAAALMLVRLANWKGWLTRDDPLLWMLHLSILWVLAYLIFMVRYTAILASPRADGKEG